MSADFLEEAVTFFSLRPALNNCNRKKFYIQSGEWKHRKIIYTSCLFLGLSKFYVHRSDQLDLSPVHQVQEVPLQDLPHDRVLGQAMLEPLTLPVRKTLDLTREEKNQK